MIIAVDIGGTKTIVAGFDESGKIVSEERVPTDKDPQQFSRTLLGLFARFDPQEVVAVCLAAPGRIESEQGIIAFSPNLGWENFALRDIVAQRFNCPIYLENDANAAGVGSVQALDTIPALSLYVTVGTGIGIGVITRGSLDPTLRHAEAGHMVFQTPRGLETWERFASGRAIAKRFGRLATEIRDQADWQTIVDEFAVGLRVLIPVLQPDVIIFGGGIGTHFKHFGPLLEQTLRNQMTEPRLVTVPPIIQASDPEKAVIRGCYYHASKQLSDASQPRT